MKTTYRGVWIETRKLSNGRWFVDIEGDIEVPSEGFETEYDALLWAKEKINEVLG